MQSSVILKKCSVTADVVLVCVFAEKVCRARQVEGILPAWEQRTVSVQVSVTPFLNMHRGIMDHNHSRR